jgi:hypothetical protein
MKNELVLNRGVHYEEQDLVRKNVRFSKRLF